MLVSSCWLYSLVAVIGPSSDPLKTSVITIIITITSITINIVGTVTITLFAIIIIMLLLTHFSPLTDWIVRGN